MIKVTRINGREFYVNPHQIECMEATPDTVMTLLSGAKFVVKERIEEIIQAIIAYRQKIGGLPGQEE